jgi:hypothetical protein
MNQPNPVEPGAMTGEYCQWARTFDGGYECSSKGDNRFSAFHAIMPDGRTLEQWYQCDIKGYDVGGTNWKLGKGKPPLFKYPEDHLWQMYLNLWRIWTVHNGHHIFELATTIFQGPRVLTDCFASTNINQARALAQIINEWIDP